MDKREARSKKTEDRRQKTEVRSKSIFSLLTSCFLLLTSYSFPAYSANPQILPWNGPHHMTLNIHPQIKATLRISQGNFEVTFPDGHSQLISTVSPGPNDEIRFEAQDYNFDGYTDLIIRQSHSEAENNVFCALFLYDTYEKTFHEVLYDSNLEVDPLKHVLLSGQRAGTKYYAKEYKFKVLTPVVAWESVTTALPGIFKVRHYNEEGVLKKVTITQDLAHMQAAKLVIAYPKVYLYSEPSTSAKSSSYLVKGDRVTLIDLAGPWDEWVLIQYMSANKSFAKKWVPVSVLTGPLSKPVI